MHKNDPINIMIHDLPANEGSKYPTLKIARELNKKFPLALHGCSIDEPSEWPNPKFVNYESRFKNCTLLNHLSYRWQSWRKLKQTSGLIQSSGAATLKSHIVLVQYIHQAWLEIFTQMPQERVPRLGLLRRVYRSLLDNYIKTMENKAYTADKRYIAISHSIKKELMEYFSIPPEQIDIIHHGVDSETFSPWVAGEPSERQRNELRKQLGVKPSDQVLLHMGPFGVRQGLHKVVRVLAYLKTHGFNNIKFMVVNGGDTKLLDQVIRKNDLQNQVIIVSDTTETASYYRASDVFFFCSFYEPFGLPILEAMASGLPVVVSSRIGSAELIENEVNGVLFDPAHSVPKIADKLLPALRDNKFREALSKEALKTARSQSWEKVGLLHQKFYDKRMLDQ